MFEARSGASYTMQLSKDLGLSSVLNEKFTLISYHKLSKKIPKSQFIQINKSGR